MLFRRSTPPRHPPLRQRFHFQPSPPIEAVFLRPKFMNTQFRQSYRPKQAAEYLGIGVATFWRWAKERQDFPKMIRLSARCTVVDRSQLVAWRDAQAVKVGA